MKKIWQAIFSSKLAMFVLSLFIVIIAAATFIEEKYDTATAKLLIYNAHWFEFLMLILIALYVGHVFKKKLFSKEKLPQLIFHLSFIFLFIGGGITRYFGYEANMHIVENESVNVLYTLEPYFQLKIPDEDIEYSSKSPLYFSQIKNNYFHLEFKTEGDLIEIEYSDYIFNAGDLFLKLAGNEEKLQYQRRNPDEKSPDALIVNITYQGKSKEMVLFYDDTRYIQPFKQFVFNNIQLELTYGPKPIEIPFSLQLDKFTLSKYPGTNIPSASESNVTLIDKRENVREKHLIAKNKVLDYDGYRFFQTSYDDDEKGTILSVNYDYYGTRITYAGYFLMLLGALLILFSRKSNFSQLDAKIKQVREKRKALLTAFIILICVNSFGLTQNKIQNPIDENHADRFGHLMVQTYDGRFSSVHSLAVDVIHKISGKDQFNIPGKGNMDEMQIFLDMHVDPDFWTKQRIIVVREKELRNMLGLSGKYASFNDFHDNRTYKLNELARNAFQKKAAEQTNLDREIIKVTERVNIFLMTINGTLLKLFPVQYAENNKWISWNDSLAFVPLTGELLSINNDFQLPDFNYRNIMRTYLVSTIYARESGDYSKTDKIIESIKRLQRQLTPDELMPSQRKIDLEVFYNKSKIFHNLKYVYALLGLVLLILTLTENFRLKPGKKLLIAIKICTALVVAAFVYQTFGMGLRWYLGGHAPWSNGYEVLLLVAWGGILAGLYAWKYSRIVLASTAILAAVILAIAGLGYYDPQLTNLNPVLKSHWLIIHVAVVTVGYGFLGLSFIIGLLSIIIFLVRSEKKSYISSLIILELTYINEKLVTIGMFSTAIGTFIGCIWANESWGTYWSWNAKQTWSFIIIITYGAILHFRLIPKLKSAQIFNIGTILAFASVIMTFVGVNYYFTKGLHSYAYDDPPFFPYWTWLIVIVLILIIAATLVTEYKRKKIIK